MYLAGYLSITTPEPPSPPRPLLLLPFPLPPNFHTFTPQQQQQVIQKMFETHAKMMQHQQQQPASSSDVSAPPQPNDQKQPKKEKHVKQQQQQENIPELAGSIAESDGDISKHNWTKRPQPGTSASNNNTIMTNDAPTPAEALTRESTEAQGPVAVAGIDFTEKPKSTSS